MGFVVDDRVVERAVRFDVAHAHAVDAGQGIEGADLVERFVGEFGWGVVDEAAAEAGRVVVGHVRAEGHAVGGGVFEGAGDGMGVSCVESGGDVGAGNHLQHGCVVSYRVARGGLAEVSIEVDVHGPSYTTRVM